MKTVKRLPLLFLILFAAILIAVFSGRSAGQSEIKKAVKQELDLLKNLDSETAQKYVSYQELFPDAAEDSDFSEDVMDVCTLLFQNFDYKIQKINVDQKNGSTSASVSLKLVTIDAASLAKDYSAARLEEEILAAANTDSQTSDAASFSLADSYRLLKELLTDGNYPTTERDCTAEVTQNADGEWEISRTSSLENDLTGGFTSSLSDPDLLSPKETLTIYLDTLKEMDESQMSAFLNVDSLLNTDDEVKNSIALALTEKVHDCFDYEILESTSEGYEAAISVKITTFDSDAIVTAYQSQMDTYLDSVDAVVDGSALRYEKSCEILLDCIESNNSTCTTQADFLLTNDGVSWKLDDSSELGSAIFGTLAEALAETDQ